MPLFTCNGFALFGSWQMKNSPIPRYSDLGQNAREGESVITRLMAEALSRPQMLSLAAGFTDNRVLPEGLVLEAVSALSGTGDSTHLQYGMNPGRPGLRGCIAQLLQGYPGEGGLNLNKEHFLVTNGSQQALYILVQMFCDPGDIVLVESPSYFVFLELLKGLGVRAVPMPADDEGRIDPGRREAVLAELRRSGEWDRVRLVYLMGAFANPSTRCIGEEEKAALAGILGKPDRPIPVIEDMAYRELYFDRPYPARSLLSLEAWRGYPVFYLGTFTKPFATGLKTGFIASRDMESLRVFARIKGHQDFGSAHFNQAILQYILESGAYASHLRHIRQHYREKCQLLETALRENGLPGAGWSWRSPQGGLLLWAKAHEKMDTRMGSPFHRACLERDILYVPGDLCFAGEAPANFVRLSFGALDRDLIPEAARRFCEAARAVS